MTDRNFQLDGLRGLAALSVAVGHCATAIGGLGPYLLSFEALTSASARDLVFRAIHVVFNADAAVPVFFVLSGLVLALSLKRRDMLAWQTTAAYLIRRALRLLPVSLVSAIILGPIVGATWSSALKAGFLIDYTMNGVIWSLQVEVIGSIVVLLAVLAAFVWRTWALYAILLVLCALPFFSHHYLIILLPCFVLGILIRLLPEEIFNSTIAALGLAVLLAGDIFIGHTLYARIAHTIGAFFVVGHVATHAPRWLLSPPIQFLGRVSYPFYLLHLAAVSIINQSLATFGVQLPPSSYKSFAALAFSSVPLALALAWIVHILVERPYIALGSEWARRVTASLTPRVSAASFP